MKKLVALVLLVSMFGGCSWIDWHHNGKRNRVTDDSTSVILHDN